MSSYYGSGGGNGHGSGGGNGPYGSQGTSGGSSSYYAGGYAGQKPGAFSGQKPGGYGGGATQAPPNPSNNEHDWFSDQSTSYGAGSSSSSYYGQQQVPLQTGTAPYYGQTQAQPQQSSNIYGLSASMASNLPATSVSKLASASTGAVPVLGNIPKSTSSGSFVNGKSSFKPSPSSTENFQDVDGLSGAIGGAPVHMSGAVSGAPLSGNFSGFNAADFEDEPPLLEELGVNIPQILKKTKAVILPVGHTSSIDTHLMDDDDLAGPLAYALMLGGELLLSGKISFDQIYGFGLFGCLAMTLIINLMTPKVDAVSLWRVTSILGYCLIPVNVLAALNCVLFLKYRGIFGVIMAGITISWCTLASTRLFERSCDMRNQRYLIAYPIGLLYTSFVIITIF